MMTRRTPQSDCETLSALLDGELTGEARRFALRRLAHDREWQRAASRWQLAGDVLRGQAVEPAPAGFADRVAAAVAAEMAGAQAPALRRPAAVVRPGRRTRWIGGAALAASVAVAALFTVRGPLDPAVGTDPLIAGNSGLETVSAPAADASPGPALAAAEPGPQELAGDGMSALAAAAPLAVAALDASRRDAPARSRGQQQRAALRTSREREGAVQVAAATAPPAARAEAPAQVAPWGAVGTPAPAATPYAAADEIVSRPWPRALPSLTGRAAFTASFDSAPQTATPSFYPFEPRLPPELREQLGVSVPLVDEPLLQQ